MENLTADSYLNYDGETCLDSDHMNSVLETLGQVHIKQCICLRKLARYYCDRDYVILSFFKIASRNWSGLQEACGQLPEGPSED